MGDEWVPISSETLRERVLAVSGALQKWGIGKGDRVAILSENRPEWMIADFASLLIGAVTVPIYATLTAEQTAYILSDSGARVVFLSSEAQLQKVLSIRGQTALEKLVVMDRCRGAATRCAWLSWNPGRPGKAGRGRLESPPGDGPRGFTGRSGYHYLYLGHDRHAQGGDADAWQHGVESELFAGGVSGAAGRCQHFISSALSRHRPARGFCAALSRGHAGASGRCVTQLPRALLEVKPTFFVAVPRVYEKIHFQTEQKAQGFPNSTFYHWALSVGKEHRAEVLAGQKPTSRSWKLADRLLFSKVRAGTGRAHCDFHFRRSAAGTRTRGVVCRLSGSAFMRVTG